MLLILVMAVFLFTGCGKKTPKDTTLEGTWRMTEEINIYKYFDVVEEKLDEREDRTPYPREEKKEDINITMIAQPYYQFKNNILTEFGYTKIEMPKELKDELELGGILEEFPIFNHLFNGVVLKLDEREYSDTGNKIVIKEEEHNKEYTYTISGKTMTMTYKIGFEYENGDWEEKEYRAILVKVNDSEVKDAKNIDDFEIPDFPF